MLFILLFFQPCLHTIQPQTLCLLVVKSFCNLFNFLPSQIIYYKHMILDFILKLENSFSCSLVYQMFINSWEWSPLYYKTVSQLTRLKWTWRYGWIPFMFSVLRQLIKIDVFLSVNIWWHSNLIIKIQKHLRKNACF